MNNLMMNLNQTRTSSAGTLFIDEVFPQTGIAREALVLLMGSWIVAACAQIEIPLWPVPVTGQTFGVIVVGALLGSKRGAAAIAAYLLQGAVGLPFFAGGAAGFLHLVGPTGGYLAGFIGAAWLTGWLAERNWNQSFAMRAASMTLGTVAIMLCGVLWLATFVPAGNLLGVGVIPFLPGAVLKIVAAALVVGGVNRR